MKSDKFDFQVAQKLVEAVEQAASQIDVKNGQIEKKFNNLHQVFKDAGYDAFERDMSAADSSIEEIIRELHHISKAINMYAMRLQDEV